jgi:hypothetical protein
MTNSIAELEAFIEQGPSVIMMSRDDAKKLIETLRKEGREQAARQCELDARNAARRHTCFVSIGQGAQHRWDKISAELFATAQRIRRGNPA